MTYLAALQETLAAEHAALFLFSHLGGEAGGDAEGEGPAARLAARLADAFDAHRQRRDDLILLVRAEGAEPVAAEPGYDVDDVGSDPVLIAAAALVTERRCGDVYGFLVANTPAGRRDWPVSALIDSAKREADFGGEPRTYPGR